MPRLLSDTIHRIFQFLLTLRGVSLPWVYNPGCCCIGNGGRQPLPPTLSPIGGEGVNYVKLIDPFRIPHSKLPTDNPRKPEPELPRISIRTVDKREGGLTLWSYAESKNL